VHGLGGKIWTIVAGALGSPVDEKGKTKDENGERRYPKENNNLKMRLSFPIHANILIRDPDDLT
jgi:hypothetical protein